MNIQITDHPDWVIDAVPGARAALEAWAEAEAQSKPSRAAVDEARRARQGKIRWEGADGDARMAPALGVTVAEFEAIHAAIRDAEVVATEQHRAVRRARSEYEALVTPTELAEHGIRKVAAAKALELHEEAESAFRVLLDALRERDRAVRLASVITDPTRISGATSKPTRRIELDSGPAHELSQDRGSAERYFEERLSQFSANRADFESAAIGGPNE